LAQASQSESASSLWHRSAGNMGCGASVQKECTPEQKAQLCALMGKEMMLLCVGPALSKCDKIKVPAPPEVTRLRKDVAQLREGAADAKQQITEAGSAAAPAPKEADGSKQGFMSGMLAKGAELAGKASESVAGVVASGAEAALNGMADQLEKAINAVEEPFVKVGQDIVEAKKDKIKAVLDYYIANLPLVGSGAAVILVRGEEPHGPEEYAKVTDALTDHLCRKCARNLVAQLMPVCEEAIKEHTVTKRWDQVIENYNSLSAKLAAIDFAKKNDLTLKPIELDIKDYIVSQCVEQIAVLMGEKELEIRKAPAQSERTKAPQIFDKVFSGNKMFEDELIKSSEGQKLMGS